MPSESLSLSCQALAPSHDGWKTLMAAPGTQIPTQAVCNARQLVVSLEALLVSLSRRHTFIHSGQADMPDPAHQLGMGQLPLDRPTAETPSNRPSGCTTVVRCARSLL